MVLAVLVVVVRLLIPPFLLAQGVQHLHRGKAARVEQRNWLPLIMVAAVAAVLEVLVLVGQPPMVVLLQHPQYLVQPFITLEVVGAVVTL
ncbi:MAG: hypothetical protein EBR82_72425 [Caulobacteraceae bacterium]|nr:hypothetical protein [Caulobacteraceae bacterium]